MKRNDKKSARPKRRRFTARIGFCTDAARGEYLRRLCFCLGSCRGLAPEPGFWDVWLARFGAEETETKRRPRRILWAAIAKRDERKSGVWPPNGDCARKRRIWRPPPRSGGRFHRRTPERGGGTCWRDVDPERGEGITTAWARAPGRNWHERAQQQSELYGVAGGSPVLPNMLGMLRVGRPGLEGALSTEFHQARRWRCRFRSD